MASDFLRVELKRIRLGQIANDFRYSRDVDFTKTHATTDYASREMVIRRYVVTAGGAQKTHRAARQGASDWNKSILEANTRLEERVCLALVTQRCLLPMAGDDQCVLRQGHKAGVNGAEQRLAVATGQVGAADGAGEEGVAGEEQFLLWEKKADAAGGVAGGVNDLRFEPGDAGGEAVFGALIERDFLWRGYAEPAGLHIEHVDQWQVLLMEKDRRAGDTFELRSPANVVDMRVRDDDLFQGEVVAREPRENGGDLVAGIDHDGLFTLQVCQDGAVAAERANGEGFA